MTINVENTRNLLGTRRSGWECTDAGRDKFNLNKHHRLLLSFSKDQVAVLFNSFLKLREKLLVFLTEINLNN